ncbi:MAG TPA: peroxiredoxin [Phenylobacterium sp.]
MKKMIVAALALSALSVPAFAALKVGAKAPDFRAQGYQAGKPINFSLADARKQGPVVVYFFPAADTKGCNLEARMFAEAADQFKAAGATLIGVTAGNLDKLAAFSADTEKCSGKFPVAADPTASIAKSYDATLPAGPKWSNRTSYVISPKGEVLLSYSNMAPDEHVSHTLAAVKAYKAK